MTEWKDSNDYEIFHVYLPFHHPVLQENRKVIRGYWETAVIAQGGEPHPYPSFTLRRFGNRVALAGKARRTR